MSATGMKNEQNRSSAAANSPTMSPTSAAPNAPGQTAPPPIGAGDFARWHKLTALMVFLVALVLYTLTMAPTTSFWDCGEFIAASKSLSVPHPPGAPFYLLLGRFFTFLPFFADIGARVNFISVLSSALTVMLLYLTVVHLIRYWRGNLQPGFAEMAGAALGALTFMATDTFWFNAVEAEVYAISMLFTALVVWLAFVWHDREQQMPEGGDRIILLIFYLVGLAIGVHLLNVLALPMVFLVIFFHWREGKPFQLDRFLVFWGLATLSILPIYPGIVLYLPKAINAVNNLGGEWAAIFFLVALFGGLGALHMMGRRSGNRLLYLGSAATILVMLGYMSYILILQRSGLNPPLDENDPETLKGLIAYLSREQYGSESIVTQLLNRKAPFWDWQIQHMYVRYFNWNFIGRDVLSGAWNWQLFGLPLIAGIWGFVTHLQRDWRRAFSIGNLFVLTGLAIVVYLNQENPQPRERDYAYVGSFYAFAIWIGIGLAVALEDIGKLLPALRRITVPALAVAMLVFLPMQGIKSNYYYHDRSGNYVAWDYARNALEMLEQDAILFTNGDNDTFPLWYLQIVEGYRTDVRVVNLSLLNTGWYIRQLRDEAPIVPLSDFFTDENIADAIDGHGQGAVSWRYWGAEVWRDRSGTPLPRDRWYKVPLRDTSGNAHEITVRPTMYVNLGEDSRENNFLRIQDRMILEILRSNQWKRPVYFAVTVAGSNFVGLDRFLRMDGLAYRIMDRPQARDIDPNILHANLDRFEEHYRGLNDADVYFDDNIQKLVQNYRSSYIQLALLEDERGNRDTARELLGRMDEYLPENVVSTINPQLSMQLGLFFDRLGDREAFISRLERLEAEALSMEDRFMLGSYWVDPLGEVDRGLAILNRLAEQDPSQQVRLEIGMLLEQVGRQEEAKALYQRVLLDLPDHPDATAAMIRIEESLGNVAEAKRLVEAWLEKNPRDSSARARLARYTAELASDSLK